MLTVRNDELTVRDDDDMSLEVAETRACAGEFRTLMWMGKRDLASWLQFTGIPSDHGN
jgi:hypothetical protein